MHSLDESHCRENEPDLYSGGSVWQDTYYETRVRTARQFRYVAT